MVSSRSQPLLRELHWLPIESRIKFKTVCFNVPMFLTELHRCTYANCANHVLTVDYAPNQEATSVLHGLVTDLLTKLSPSQRHLAGTHCN